MKKIFLLSIILMLIIFIPNTYAETPDWIKNTAGWWATDAILNGISGKRIFILESNFSNSEMKNFQISEAWFQSTSFYNADMRNGDFDSITFIDLDFSETEFQGTKFTSLNEFGNNNYSCKNGTICNDG